jgi:O-antigen/teichoic acid export membrane protein
MNHPWTKYLPAYLRSRVHGRHTLQRVIGNSGWLLVDRVFRAAVGLFIGVWMARFLGPAELGLLNYTIAFVSLFSAVATLGLDGIVVRDIARDPHARDAILGTAFVLKLGGAAATLLLAGISIALLRPAQHHVWLLVAVIAAGTVFQAFDAVDFWFQSQIQSKYAVYAKSFAFGAMALVKIGLILMAAPLVAFAVAGSVELALGAAGLIVVYRRNGGHPRAWKFRAARAKAMLSDSWPLILSGLAIYVQARIDQVMLGEMIGDAEVGQYSVAMRLIEAFAFLPMIIHSSVAPTVTQAKLRGEPHYLERLTNIYRLMLIVFLVLALPIFMFSDSIVLLLYGQAYQQAGFLLSLLAIRLFFANFGIARSLFITNENMFKHALFAAVAGSLVNVILNCWLIPVYMSAGAIVASMASFFVTVFLADLFSPRARINLAIMTKAILSPWKLRFS